MEHIQSAQIRRYITQMNKLPPTHGLGARLESVISKKSRKSRKSFWKSVKKNKSLAFNSLSKSTRKTLPEIEKLGWWTPPQDSLPMEFCENSSIHGLFFIAKSNIHLVERIFWTIAFILGIVAAVLLINDVWERYYKNPVIVSFQSREVDIDSIPFPAVTICNMNAFPRSKMKQLEEQALQYGSEGKSAREALKYARSVCNTQLSFAKEFHFAVSRGENEDDMGWNDTITEDSQDEMVDFLLEHTIDCDKLIRLCMFGEQRMNCKNIFKPVITDYGKCCIFNSFPLPLLLKNPQSQDASLKSEAEDGDEILTEHNPALGTKERWSEDELNLWKLWEYQTGFVLSNKSLTRPFLQKRAGMPYGLSLLVDPNLDDWYCPVSDSKGFRFLLHNPLENPHVNSFASLIELNKEIFVEIHPDMTNADDDIEDFKLGDRNCYFPKERKLKFYVPYTGGNCEDDCTALVLQKKCNCSYFYMPRDENINVCNTDPESKDYACIEKAKVDSMETLEEECGHCYPLCENVEYNFECTMSNLQGSLNLWNDPDPEHHVEGTPPWANNKMSIVHMFIGSETIVPKLIKRLYGNTDLIANTGGILGLCLGVSVLSAVEFVYFLTIRSFWKFCWPRVVKKKVVRVRNVIRPFQSGTRYQMAEQSRCSKGQMKVADTVIELDPNRIPVVNRSNVPYYFGITSKDSSH